MSGVHAVVLAAGAGSRFGGGKLVAPWNGRVVIDGCLDAALAAPVESVVVVTGADAAAIEAVVRARGGERLRTVHAVDHGLGLSASLRRGLASLPHDASGALIFLGDMPLVPHNILPDLIDALSTGAVAAAPWRGGRRGHPVAVSRRLFPALLLTQGDRGAGLLLDALGDRLVKIATDDPGIVFDVDVPADLATLTPL
jgi:molybdenum cofactor cytidylyltransferase